MSAAGEDVARAVAAAILAIATVWVIVEIIWDIQTRLGKKD